MRRRSLRMRSSTQVKSLKSSKYNLIFSLLAVLALWGAWAIAYVCVGNDLILPSVGDTAAEMVRLLGEAAFWRAFGATLLRTVGAFVCSAVPAVLLALCACLFPPVRAFLTPVVSVLRTVPTMALVLVLLLWTSPSAAPVVIAALVLFPAVYAAADAGLSEVKEEYGEMAEVFAVPRFRQAWKMYLPLSAPPVLRQTGAMLSLGLKIAVSGEVLSVTAASLGGMMQQAQGFLEMPRLLALTLVTVAVGFLFEGVCALVCRLVVRWRR